MWLQGGECWKLTLRKQRLKQGDRWTVVIILQRWYWFRRGRAGEKWSDSGYILKAVLTVFADGTNMGHKVKWGARDDVKVFDLSKWKEGVSINRGEKDCGWPFSLCPAFGWTTGSLDWVRRWRVETVKGFLPKQLNSYILWSTLQEGLGLGDIGLEIKLDIRIMSNRQLEVKVWVCT